MLEVLKFYNIIRHKAQQKLLLLIGANCIFLASIGQLQGIKTIGQLQGIK